MPGDRDREAVAAIAVAAVALMWYAALTGVDGAIGFFTTRFLLFMSIIFLIRPFIDISFSGFRDGVRLNAVAVSVAIGIVFLLIYMTVTDATPRMMFELSLEYVMYAIIISWLGGKVRENIIGRVT